jgi:hypothetical protein
MSTFALFQTTRSAIRAERVCKQEGIACKLVPVPRQFSSECGIAIEFDQSIEQTIRDLFTKEQIIADFHTLM